MTKRGRGQRRNRRLKNRSNGILRRLYDEEFWRRIAATVADWAAVYVAFNCEPRRMGVA